jgi:sterol desaturase/sphingolipid hydroxylase (fatty acid hydroxylase superfamily)
VENFSHANTTLDFGRIGDRLVVGPLYHRWHHALELPEGRRFRYGCNFAILLPIWDWVFGTLYLAPQLPPTGVVEHDATETQARDSFWAQQKLGLAQMWQALSQRRAS